MNSDNILKSIEVNVSPESAFEAISIEDELKKWWVDVPKLELVVGGMVNFRFLKENSQLLENDFVIEGKILELIPNQKLSYSWKPVDDENYPDTIVTWTIEPTNNGSKVTVLHSGLEGVKDYSRLVDGWEYFLGKLQNLLNSQT